MPEEKRNDQNTAVFLRTNGPPDGAFKPDIPAHLLHGKTESEIWLYEMVGVSTKQNEWLINQVIGLKGAHRTINHRLNEGDMRFQKIEQSIQDASLIAVQTVAGADARFKKIDQTLDTFSKFMPILEKFTAFWERWMSRRNVAVKVGLGVITLLLLPFLSVMAVEVVKHVLGWK